MSTAQKSKESVLPVLCQPSLRSAGALCCRDLSAGFHSTLKRKTGRMQHSSFPLWTSAAFVLRTPQFSLKLTPADGAYWSPCGYIYSLGLQLYLWRDLPLGSQVGTVPSSLRWGVATVLSPLAARSCHCTVLHPLRPSLQLWVSIIWTSCQDSCTQPY